jgi:hypothetical protein
MKSRLLTMIVLAFAAACGGGGGTGDDANLCDSTERYMTLVTGESWTYRVTDSNNVRTAKTQTVGAEEDIGGELAGTTAFRLTTVKGTTGQGMTISWQQDTGSGIVRLREQDDSGGTTTDEYYMPLRHRIDESAAHIVPGAAWDESYTEEVYTDGGTVPTTADKTEHWTVIADDETVTVPAGTFCTLHLHRTSMVGGVDGSDKEYWFARGVGKVKERGAGQTEELESSTR